jgi:DNA mismatch repair protein MutS
MSKQKLYLTEEYFNYQEEYTKKFGERTLVLMNVGAFFEMYETNEQGYDLNEISKILDMVKTKKSSKDPSVGIKNPYMIGFPVESIVANLHTLTENGITVVVIEQTTPPPHPKREVTGIYTPGTNIMSYTPDNSFVASIYIKEEKQLKSNSLIIIGISLCDITTGKTFICDASSHSNDERKCFDESVRFLHTYRPKEVIIFTNIQTYTLESLKSYLDLTNNNVHVIGNINQHYFKMSYQTEILKKVYPTHGLIHPLEYIGVEKLPHVAISFVMLLDYIYSANPSILANINVPELFSSTPILYIGNSATLQLNIFDTNTYDVNTQKVKCLFDVIDNTNTPMGRRYFINKLNAPYIDTNALQKIYDVTENMINDKKNIIYEKHLSLLSDIEKLHRKMVLGIISINEFYNFTQSMSIILTIFKQIQEHTDLLDYFIFAKKTKTLRKMIERIEKIWNIANMKSYMYDKTIPIYNTGVYSDIDELYEEYTSKINFMDSLCKKLSSFIGDSSTQHNLITVKKNDRNGYYFSTTQKRAVLLQKKLNEIPGIKIGKNLIETKSFVFSFPTTKVAKISVPEISVHSDDIISLQNQLKLLVKKYFVNDITEIISEYGNYIKKIIRVLSELDYVVSNAKTSQLYGYSKPTIQDCDFGFVDCTQLRHPIIERIIEHEYITHDLCIGKPKMKGILLYGLNSSGKSSMMKALGLSVIMAQAGMFVPAKTFTFSPYTAIFTRISGNDNIFKELSSFGVEMIELKAIWKRSNQKTLIIGDEVCRGTEHISGNAIVASTLIKLSNVNSTFIFATHLHDIIKLPQIKQLKTIKAFHLSVSHDPIKDELIYDRQLKEGSGDDVYGVTVAKYIIRDDEFTKLTSEIKDELLGTKSHIIQPVVSKYNSDIYVDTCGICNKKIKRIDGVSTLDTHHINQQKDCHDGLVDGKKYLKKNSKTNLIVLCKECHNKIHDGTINIDKYVMTSDGKKLL